ncbi:MAG TPA: TerB family tellurite resistance protein [Kofleriaceae bacterium]
MAGERIFDHGIGQLFARALVAVARADDQISPEEGARLQERIEARTGAPVSLDDLLLADGLHPRALAQQLVAHDPFRNAEIHPRDLAAMLVADGITVALAKGYVAEIEAREIVRFARALGCPDADIMAMMSAVAPWLGSIAGM